MDKENVCEKENNEEIEYKFDEEGILKHVKTNSPFEVFIIFFGLFNYFTVIQFVNDSHYEKIWFIFILLFITVYFNFLLVFTFLTISRAV
jgi:hypothetical protein